ncbi:DUF927 domain-containing protein [Thioalkalivibrio sp.]|uniref:DUF927 domain-containing protein n=1 Tax=Thioalkalivibrio sp. TaxID=2093813 RepID=UPI003565EEA6
MNTQFTAAYTLVDLGIAIQWGRLGAAEEAPAGASPCRSKGELDALLESASEADTAFLELGAEISGLVAVSTSTGGAREFLGEQIGPTLELTTSRGEKLLLLADDVPFDLPGLQEALAEKLPGAVYHGPGSRLALEGSKLRAPDGLDEVPGMMTILRSFEAADIYRVVAEVEDFDADLEGVIYNEASRGGDIVSQPVVKGMLRVLRRTATADGRRHGVVVDFLAVNGEYARVPLDADELHNATQLIRKLALRGLQVVGQPKLLALYLRSYPVSEVVTLAEHTGWHEVDGRQVFVMGEGEVIGGNDASIEFSPSSLAKPPAFARSGTLARWLDQVWRYVLPNPIPLALTLLALASTLLSVLRAPGGGLHLWGGAGTGKTTILQVLASAFGSGVATDEVGGTGTEPYISKYNATGNGLEALASGYQGAPLLLDEIGELSPDQLGVLVYMLASGQGKTRMRSNQQLATISRWLTLIISVGERSVDSMIRESGQRVMAGQAARMPSVPLDSVELFPNLGGMNSKAELMAHLKTATATTYGTAAPALIAHIAGATERWPEWRERWDVLARTMRPDGMGDSDYRVVRRLALGVLAGEIALEAGVLTGDADTFREAVEELKRLWLEAPTEAMQALREYFRENRDFFVTGADQLDGFGRRFDEPGYLDRRRGLLFITKAVFSAEFPMHKELLAELKEKGLLYRDRPDRVLSRFGNNRYAGYAIKLSAFDEEVDRGSD